MTRNTNVYLNVLRNNVKVTELYYRTPPVLTMRSDSQIYSSLSGDYLPNSEVDWFKDTIQPVVEINGEEYHLGVFLPATIRTSRLLGQETVTVEAYDRAWHVMTNKTSSILHFSRGTPYLTVIEYILAQCGIALAHITPMDFTLQNDREDWNVGTDYLTIINGLLKEINYKPLWFDGEGFAMIEPILDLSARNLKRSYDEDIIDDLVRDDSYVEIDLYDAPNVFVCVVQNLSKNNRTTLTATAMNTNPASPLSINRRGRKIYSVQQVTNIASQQALNRYAELLCQQNSMLGETAKIKTGIIPNCGVNEVVSVQHNDMSGLFRETSWTMSLEPNGEMVHTLERVVGDVI